MELIISDPQTLLWIQLGFIADPGSQTNDYPDSNPSQTLKWHKVEYFHEKCNVIGQKNLLAI